jgi:Emfourin
MKLTIVRGGGLAGMVTSTELSSDALPVEEASRLREMIQQAGLLALPQTITSEERYPDQLQYELTVEDDGQQHTVRVSESALPESVRSLIAWVDSVPQRQDRIGPPDKR